MAKISPDFEVLLKYAEKNRYCLYLVIPGQAEQQDEIFDQWEDMLWDTPELRTAIEDYPSQDRAGQEYPAYSYPFDINTPDVWLIVNPSDLFERFMRKADKVFNEAEQLKASAEHFKRVWIDKTESNIDAYNNKELKKRIMERLNEMRKKGVS